MTAKDIDLVVAQYSSFSTARVINPLRPEQDGPHFADNMMKFKFSLVKPERHIRVSRDCATIGSDNGLSPVWRQAIIWINAGLLSIGPLTTHFSEISIIIHQYSCKNGSECVICKMVDNFSLLQCVKLSSNIHIYYAAVPMDFNVTKMDTIIALAIFYGFINHNSTIMFDGAQCGSAMDNETTKRLSEIWICNHIL